MSYAVQRKRDKLYLDLKRLPKKVRFSKVPVLTESRAEAIRHCWYDGLAIVCVNDGVSSDRSKYGCLDGTDVFVMHCDQTGYDVWYRADGGLRIVNQYDVVEGPVAIGNWSPTDLAAIRRDCARGRGNVTHAVWMLALEALPGIDLPAIEATPPADAIVNLSRLVWSEEEMPF
jgi:hypothetical protein